MNNTGKDMLALTAGLGAGAGLMYLFDPARGRARRRRLAAEASGLLRRDEHKLEKSGKYLWNKARGVVTEAAAVLNPGEYVADDVLVERVRSRMGHVISKPHEIEVHASNGVVRLEGQIPHAEKRLLRKEIEAIAGVKCVHDQTSHHFGVSPGILVGLAAGLGFIGKAARAKAQS